MKCNRTAWQRYVIVNIDDFIYPKWNFRPYLVLLWLVLMSTCQLYTQISNSDPCMGGINQIFNVGYERGAIASDEFANTSYANDGNLETVFSIPGDSPFWCVELDTFMLVHGVEVFDNNSVGANIELIFWIQEEDSIVIELNNNPKTCIRMRSEAHFSKIIRFFADEA
jgi:hypothetical protein